MNRYELSVSMNHITYRNRRKFRRESKFYKMISSDVACKIISIIALLVAAFAFYIVATTPDYMLPEEEFEKIINDYHSKIDTSKEPFLYQTGETTTSIPMEFVDDTVNITEVSMKLNQESPSQHSSTEVVKTLTYDPEKDDEYVLQTSLGDYEINLPNQEDELIKQQLPTAYYENIDFSSFMPLESVEAITNTRSPAYKICYSENAYSDDLGFMRYKTSDDQFTVDSQDDYIVAMGTFYKTKGTAGERFLIVTTTGMYTVICGDEKSDNHTDDMNMFTLHNGKAAVLEWIVDDSINSTIKRSGNAKKNGMIEENIGSIQYIYKIV